MSLAATGICDVHACRLHQGWPVIPLIGPEPRLFGYE